MVATLVNLGQPKREKVRNIQMVHKVIARVIDQILIMQFKWEGLHVIK